MGVEQGANDYVQLEKSRLKMSFLLYKAMYYITHLILIKIINKQYMGLYDNGTHFVVKKIGLFGNFGPIMGHITIFSNISITLQSSI